MFATMKPVVVCIDVARYARALTHLRDAITCYHGLDEAWSRPANPPTTTPNVARAFDLMVLLETALYGATRMLRRAKE
jgi:hypothetical protein